MPLFESSRNLLVEILLAKSNDNIEAAKLLIEKDLPNSSVHCSYYSCLQLATYILVERFGETFVSIKEKSRDEKGTHVTIIKLLGKALTRSDYNVRDFNNDINQLKSLRVQVDYFGEEIDKPMGRDIRKSAIAINDKLKKQFSIV